MQTYGNLNSNYYVPGFHTKKIHHNQTASHNSTERLRHMVSLMVVQVMFHCISPIYFSLVTA